MGCLLSSIMEAYEGIAPARRAEFTQPGVSTPGGSPRKVPKPRRAGRSCRGEAPPRYAGPAGLGDFGRLFHLGLTPTLLYISCPGQERRDLLSLFCKGRISGQE